MFAVMPKTAVRAAAGVLISALMFAPAFAQDPAPAQSAPAAAAPAAGTALRPPVIALFDSQAVLRESLAGKDVRRQLDDLQKKFRGDLQGQQESLRKREQDLQAKRAVMNAEAFEAEAKKFEAEVNSSQKRFEDRNKQIQGALLAAEEQIQKAITPILGDLMRSRGATLLMDKSLVMISATDYDITPEAIRSLDARLPSLKVDLNAKPAGAAAGAGGQAPAQAPAKQGQ